MTHIEKVDELEDEKTKKQNKKPIYFHLNGNFLPNYDGMMCVWLLFFNLNPNVSSQSIHHGHRSFGICRAFHDLSREKNLIFIIYDLENAFEFHFGWLIQNWF